MGITYKIAESTDLEILLKLIKEFCEADNHPFEESSIRVALTNLLQDKSLGRVWLIQQAKQTIGYIVLTFGYSLEYRGRDAFVDELYIRESYRRQGIGTKSLQFIESVCPELKIQVLHLEVEKENMAAQGLYRKIGFKNQERYLMTKWTNI
ncbi:MAG: GNAT family N-acetyltransferase [Coleofasciculaceae cyanobacterium]